MSDNDLQNAIKALESIIPTKSLFKKPKQVGEGKKEEIVDELIYQLIAATKSGQIEQLRPKELAKILVSLYQVDIGAITDLKIIDEIARGALDELEAVKKGGESKKTLEINFSGLLDKKTSQKVSADINLFLSRIVLLGNKGYANGEGYTIAVQGQEKTQSKTQTLFALQQFKEKPVEKHKLSPDNLQTSTPPKPK